MGQLSETTQSGGNVSATRRRFEAELATRQLLQLGMPHHVIAIVDPFAQSSSGNVTPAADCSR